MLLKAYESQIFGVNLISVHATGASDLCGGGPLPCTSAGRVQLSENGQNVAIIPSKPVGSRFCVPGLALKDREVPAI